MLFPKKTENTGDTRETKRPRLKELQGAEGMRASKEMEEPRLGGAEVTEGMCH